MFHYSSLWQLKSVFNLKKRQFYTINQIVYCITLNKQSTLIKFSSTININHTPKGTKLQKSVYRYQEKYMNDGYTNILEN